MARELLTNWGDFQVAIDRLLELAEREILVYDGDLAHLKLDSAPRIGHLKRLLQPRRQDCLRLSLQDTTLLQRNNPRLIGLMADYTSGIPVLQTPEHLGHRRDSMILVDGRHGLILFERSQPRSKLLIDEMQEIEPYLQCFEQIWQEGGTPFSATTLGL